MWPPKDKEIIPIPSEPPVVEMTNYEKARVTTEDAFDELIASAKRNGLQLSSELGLMYLPEQALTVNFQKACHEIFKALGVQFPEEP